MLLRATSTEMLLRATSTEGKPGLGRQSGIWNGSGIVQRRSLTVLQTVGKSHGHGVSQQSPSSGLEALMIAAFLFPASTVSQGRNSGAMQGKIDQEWSGLEENTGESRPRKVYARCDEVHKQVCCLAW